MTTPDPTPTPALAPASSPSEPQEMVSVPAELLTRAERVLNDPYSQTATMGWVLRDLLALAQPQPAAAAPADAGLREGKGPSAMAVLLMVAAAVQNHQERQKAGIDLFSLTVLNPAHLRSLAHALLATTSAPQAEAGAEEIAALKIEADSYRTRLEGAEGAQRVRLTDAYYAATELRTQLQVVLNWRQELAELRTVLSPADAQAQGGDR